MAEGKQAETQLVIYRHNDAEALAVLKDALQGDEWKAVAPDDPDEISRQIIAEILAATNVDELERRPAESWGDYLGVPMRIDSWSARPSSFDQGNSFFMVVRATDGVKGEPHILTIGSKTVCAQLIKLAELNLLPATRILEEVATQNEGRKVRQLVSTPAELKAREGARVEARKAEGAA